MKMYAIGTINANRIGYCPGVIRHVKKRDPKTEERGQFKLARSLDVPLMTAVTWLDNNAVHWLSSGAVCTESTVNRTPKHGGPKEPAVCPQVVRDYHEQMGGVDRHDQLRLQRYSLQMHFRCKKYYKALFLGLVDLVIVNAYITHIKCANDLGQNPLSRADFMQELHSQLSLQSAVDFQGEEQLTPIAAPTGKGHTIAKNDSWRVVNGQKVRRRNACKVCSVLYRKKGEKSNESSWYCEQCSEDNKRLFLCNKIRAELGATKTCFDVWHQDWRGRVPPTAKSTIQTRPTGVKRKRVRRTLLEETKGSDSDSEDYD